jgi:ribosomal protein S30
MQDNPKARKKTAGHGGLTKAGKVRAQTPKISTSINHISRGPLFSFKHKYRKFKTKQEKNTTTTHDLKDREIIDF